MFRRYPWVRQNDETDCGAAALATLARYHRRPLSVERMRDLAGTDRVGTTLLGLLRGAEGLGFAAKAVKESRYHVRHCAEWVVTLGDGTEESHSRAQAALDDLWRYTGELFIADDVDREVANAGLGVDPSTLSDRWNAEVARVLDEATLTIPKSGYMQRGGREGKHTEHLGHMLSEMQIVARSHPGASW